MAFSAVMEYNELVANEYLGSYHIPPLGGILAHVAPRTKANHWRRAPQEMLMQKVIEQFQFAGCCGSI